MKMRIYDGFSTKALAILSVLTRFSAACGSSGMHGSIQEPVGYCRSGVFEYGNGNRIVNNANASQIIFKDNERQEEAEIDTPSLLYEVKTVPGKGLGAVATRSIPQGTHIIIEKPLFYVSFPTFQPGQGFRIADMLPSIESRFSTLSPPQRDEVLSLHDHRFPSEEAENQSHLLTIFRSNAYNTGDSHIGLFPKIARVNHDCTPNAGNFWSEERGERIIYAMRDIAAGEEITDSYIPLLKSTEKRRERLQQYGFTCMCDACKSEESSRRRVRIADLMEDLEGKVGKKSMKQEVRRKRMLKAEKLVGMLKEEGLVEYFPRAFHLVAAFYKQMGDFEMARVWKMKELEFHRWSDEDSKEAREAREFIASLGLKNVG